MASPFVWHELMTTDAAAAAAFYTAVTGWTARNSGMPDVVYTLPREARDAGARPGWTGYVAVPDIDSAVARIGAAGGTVLMAPMQVPGGAWVIQGQDPQGVVFALVGQRPA